MNKFERQLRDQREVPLEEFTPPADAWAGVASRMQAATVSPSRTVPRVWLAVLVLLLVLAVGYWIVREPEVVAVDGERPAATASVEAALAPARMRPDEKRNSGNSPDVLSALVQEASASPAGDASPQPTIVRERGPVPPQLVVAGTTATRDAFAERPYDVEPNVKRLSNAENTILPVQQNTYTLETFAPETVAPATVRLSTAEIEPLAVPFAYRLPVINLPVDQQTSFDSATRRWSVSVAGGRLFGEREGSYFSEPIVTDPGNRNLLVTFLPDGTPVYLGGEDLERGTVAEGPKFWGQLSVDYRFRPHWRVGLMAARGTFANRQSTDVEVLPGRFYGQNYARQEAWLAGLSLDYLGGLGRLQWNVGLTLAAQLRYELTETAWRATSAVAFTETEKRTVKNGLVPAPILRVGIGYRLTERWSLEPEVTAFPLGVTSTQDLRVATSRVKIGGGIRLRYVW